MSAARDELAEVLRAHGVYGFNGSQIACRCSHRQWRYLLDWHDHVADHVARLLDAARGDALMLAAKEAEERGDIGKDGGPEAWTWLRIRADRIGGAE